MNDDDFELSPSESWSDDLWYKDQEHRNLINNEGWKIINEGTANGTILGGNLCTFNLLQGTEFFPKIHDDSVLFIEDDEMAGGFSDVEFDRNLQSVIHLPQFDSIRGVVIGRFQKASNMAIEKISKIIHSKTELKDLPVIADVNFGHTDPKITFPIGGEVYLEAKDGKIKLVLTKH